MVHRPALCAGAGPIQCNIAQIGPSCMGSIIMRAQIIRIDLYVNLLSKEQGHADGASSAAWSIRQDSKKFGLRSKVLLSYGTEKSCFHHIIFLRVIKKKKSHLASTI